MQQKKESAGSITNMFPIPPDESIRAYLLRSEDHVSIFSTDISDSMKDIGIE